MAQRRLDVQVSDPERLIFPAARLTRAEVFDFYSAIASYLLPHLKNRPVTLKRYPDSGQAMVANPSEQAFRREAETGVCELIDGSVRSGRLRLFLTGELLDGEWLLTKTGDDLWRFSRVREARKSRSMPSLRRTA